MTRSVVRSHLTVDAVADHLEGLLPDDKSAEAERHLSECVDCSAIRDDLVAVREMLATQAAEPMPDTVALRIEAALAEAWSEISAGRAAASDTRVDVAAADVDLAAAEAGATSMDPQRRTQARSARRRRRRFIPVFAAAAGTIGVVFTAALIGPQLLDGSAGDDDGSTGGVAITLEGGDRGDPGESRAEEDAGAMSGGEADAPFGAESLPEIAVSQSGRDYTSYTLAAGVADLLAAERAEGGRGEPPFSPNETLPPGASLSPNPTPTLGGSSTSVFPFAAPGQPLAPFADGGSRLRACIRELAGQDVDPILVDLGTFAGDPAVVIVLPDEVDPASATAWAVDPRCGSGLPPEETTYAVVTTPHPTAAPTPARTPGLDQPTSPID